MRHARGTPAVAAAAVAALSLVTGLGLPRTAHAILPPQSIGESPRAGGYAQEHEYAVAVSFRDAADAQLTWCSAVLVSPRHVITANHCFDAAPAAQYVLVGVSVEAADADYSDWQSTGDTSQADNHWWLPAHEWSHSYDSDMALITLDYPVPPLKWANLLPDYIPTLGYLASNDWWLRDMEYLTGVPPLLEPDAVLAGHSYFDLAASLLDGYAHYGTTATHWLEWDGDTFGYPADVEDYVPTWGDSGSGLYLFPTGNAFEPYVAHGRPIAAGVMINPWPEHPVWSATSTVFASWFPIITSPYDSALYASGSLKVNDRAAAGDGIVVGDRVELGVDATVGPVITGYNRLTDRGASMAGLYTNSSVEDLAWWGVDWYPAPPGTTCDRRHTVLDFDRGSESNMSGSTLAPYFSYGNLHLYSGTEVTLTSGSYYFDSLFLEPDSTLHFDTADGPVLVYVTGGLVNRGLFGTPGQAGQVFVGVDSDDEIHIERNFNGTLAAPAAKVTLNTPGYYYGAFWAKDIEVHQGGYMEVHSVPFESPGLWSSSQWGMCSPLPDASLPRLHITGNLHIYNDYAVGGGYSIDVPIDEYAYLRLDDTGVFRTSVSGCHEVNKEVLVVADLAFSPAGNGAVSYSAEMSLYEHADVQPDSGGACRRVDRDGHTTYTPAEPLSLGEASGFTFEMTNDEPADGDFSTGWITIAYECPEAGCADGAACASDGDCRSGNCSEGICIRACIEESAVELGLPGHEVTVNNAGCVRIRDGRQSIASWWGSRYTTLVASNGVYPVPFAWHSECAGQGSAVLVQDWAGATFGPVSIDCATVVELQGSGSGNVTLRYW